MFEGAPKGFDVELGLLKGFVVVSAGEATPKGEEAGFPKGFTAASSFEGAPKGFEFELGLLNGFVDVFVVDAAPNVVAAGFPKGFTAPSDFGGAPNGFEFEVEVFALDGVLDFGAKGLNVAGAADPKEDGAAAGACAKGVVVVGEGGLLKGPGFCSVAVFENLFGLLVYEPLPLPPLPLTIVPFSL